MIVSKLTKLSIFTLGNLIFSETVIVEGKCDNLLETIHSKNPLSILTSCSDSDNIGSKCSITCPTGYQMKRGTTVVNGLYTFKCKEKTNGETAWKVYQNSCEKIDCFEGRRINHKSNNIVEYFEDGIFSSFSVKKAPVSSSFEHEDFDADKGWTVVLKLAQPLTSGVFYGVNSENWSVNKAGDLVSFTSKSHNRDFLQEFGGDTWGSESRNIFGLVFDNIGGMNVTVSTARFYNFEFSNTACLTDGGTFGFVDGTGWAEGVEIPSERDGIQVLGQLSENEDVTDAPATGEPITNQSATTEKATTEKATTEKATTEKATTEEATTKESTTKVVTNEEYCEPTFLGCFIDPTQGQFALTKLHHNILDHMGDSNYPFESCINACKSEGYSYSGLNRGTECFCGNDLPSVKSDEADCDSECDFDSGCGGFMRVSVFDVDSCDGNTDDNDDDNDDDYSGDSDFSGDSDDDSDDDSDNTTQPPNTTTQPPRPITQRPTPRPPGNQTDLEHYISTTDEAYGWVDNEWNIYGDDFLGLADYNWITLTSQQYLSDEFVENGIWRHNVILCVGHEIDANAADVGMIWLNGYGQGPDIAEYPKRQQEMENACKQAAQLGTVGVILDGVPSMVKFHDVDEAESEKFQITGASYYFDGDADISAIAEFPEAKAVSMTMNMVDEYILQKGLRSSGITRWSVTGGSKRGGATLAVAAAEPRVAIAFPVIQNVFHAMPEVFAHDLNCLGGYNSGWAAHATAGWYRWFLTESDKRERAELSLNLNKYHKERMVNLPMQFLLGSQDMMMHLDNINVWWDEDWSTPQKSSLFIQPNVGHSGGRGNDEAMFIMVQALINNEIDDLPYLNWFYSMSSSGMEDALNVCLERNTENFTAKLYRGVSESGRDFRGRGDHNADIFKEVASCDQNMDCTVQNSRIEFRINSNQNCYQFIDMNSLEDGEYSAMYFTVYFETDYLSTDGENLVHTQSSGPLVRPNTLPFEGTCTKDSCDLEGITKV